MASTSYCCVCTCKTLWLVGPSCQSRVCHIGSPAACMNIQTIFIISKAARDRGVPLLVVVRDIHRVRSRPGDRRRPRVWQVVPKTAVPRLFPTHPARFSIGSASATNFYRILLRSIRVRSTNSLLDRSDPPATRHARRHRDGNHLQHQLRVGARRWRGGIRKQRTSTCLQLRWHRLRLEFCIDRLRFGGVNHGEHTNITPKFSLARVDS